MYLKEWCELRGLRAADLARITNSDRSSVSRWFNARVIPVKETITLLAETLGIEEDALFILPDEYQLFKAVKSLNPEERALGSKIARLLLGDVAEAPVPEIRGTELPSDVPSLARLKRVIQKQLDAVDAALLASAEGKEPPKADHDPELIARAMQLALNGM